LPKEFKELTPEQLRAMFAPERRTVEVPLQELEWRESGSGDGSRILTGYAAVYNQETTLYAGTYYTIKERINEGAFFSVLQSNPDVHFNMGHDMNRAMARTGIKGVGGLELSSDGHGLRVYARLNQNDPDVQCLAAKMDLGIMDQMSFAFQVKAKDCKYTSVTDENGMETDTREINNISNLYDVCVCAQGAYPTTEASLRSLLNISGMRSIEVPPKTEERSDEVPQKTDSAQNAVERDRLMLQARAKVATIKFTEVQQ
jgi:HK97 family phage prohead protease